MLDDDRGSCKWWGVFREGSRKHSVMAVTVLSILLSGIGAVAGDANVSWPWLFLLACNIAAVAAFATLAIQAESYSPRLRNLCIALGFAILVPIGAFTYHEQFDPALSEEDFGFLVDASEGAPVQLYTEPQGVQTYQFGVLLGGGVVQVACIVHLESGKEWYRVTGRGGYLPSELVRPPRGVEVGVVPEC